MAINYAKQFWDVDLPVTDHDRLPLMGEQGCTAAPHLRPLCSIHTCEISNFGCKPNDKKWTDKYFGLRSEIEKIEFEEFM